MEVPESKVDLVDLSHKLKEVRLFAKSERQLLQTLFSDNREQADRIFQTAWITRQQRHILNKLILASPEAPPNVCCYQANNLETVNFIDSYKQLGFQDTLYGEFLAHLRDNPQAIALSLALGEKQNPRESQKAVAVVISSVFGNCIGAEDERRTLLFLQSLMQHQLAESDDPRRLLLKGNCSFCTAFKHFTESLFSSKLYLTAALHDSIMTVLMDDESSLETDPDKAVEQFTNEERIQKFGSPDSDGYHEKLQAHLQSVMGQLVVLCEKFIDGLRSNMFCFPQSLDWIISELHKILVKRGKASVSEVRAMCADLLFNWFICPAIVDPEPFGIISDILVSENARFNLMQIAKILQQLAHLNDANAESGRERDILNRFEKNCMSSFLDSLINSMKLSDTPPTASDLGGMTQNATLITETDLHRLVSYFRDVVANNPDRSELKEIENCLSTLPASPQPMSKNLLSPPILNQGENNRQSVASPVAFKNSVAAKVSSVTKKSRKNTSDSGDTESEVSDSQSLDAMSVWQQEDVMVVSLGVQSFECPGMLPESKVLATISSKKVLPETETDIPQASLAATSGIPEKHLRFSADASGNSDNMMEAMSIGASNSVYSMDMETDIVSNLSGRNTPRSAISMASSTTEHQRPEIIDSTQLPNSTNITDQFGKFEIEKQNCDIDRQRVMNPEIYSETWSTDVIGSDTSEPPSEANPIEHLKEIAEIQDEEPDLPGAGAGASATVTILDIQHSDIIETGSETWSVDVLQSDSEFIDDRLQEVEDVAPSEMNLQEAASVESGMEEVDVASSKASEGQSSRRSSASIDRSSSNEMDEAKKEKFLDTSDLPPPALPAGMGRQPLNFELTSPSTSSSSILEVPPPLPPRPHKSRDGESGPPLPPRGKQIPPPNPFLTTSGSNSSGFQPLTYTSSPSTRTSSQSILQDFDPLASSSNQGPNPFADSLDGKMQTVKRSLPPGAKPKERPFFPPPPLPSGDSPQDADGTSPSFQPAKTESYNPLYQLHHKGSGFNHYGPSPSQNTIHDSAMNSNISHVNHGFFDPSMNFDPSMDIHQGARNSFPSSEQTSIAPPARFQTSLERPPSLKGKPRNAYSVPLPTNQPVLPLNSGSKDGEGFLNGEVEKEFGSNLIPANMQSRDGDFDASFYSTDPEVDFSRSSGSDGFDMAESPADRMGGVGNGEKGKSWFKKKFKQINSKMARSKGSKGGSGQHDLTLSAGLDSELDFNRKSDDLQVIPNLALVKDGFEDSNDLKASSVPVNSGEDILNKYRCLRKTQSTEGLDADGLQQDSSADEHSSHSDRPDSTLAEQGSSDLELSSNDGSYAFNDAKRKLQIVLRSADISSMPWLSRFSEETGQRELFMFGGQYPQNELLAFLKALQAEAVNLQDRSLIAQLWETLRCVQSMDNEGCKKLLQSLRDDHERSSVYIAYLIRCRKGLTTTKAHLGRLMERIQRDKDVVNKFFTMVCVRLFLERQEESIQKFISDFKRLTAADEKTQLVKAFLNTLNTWIQQDPIWEAASEEQKIDAEIATERAIMTTVYKLALYPNGDGDIHRDQVLHNHIEKLSKVVSANHKSLQIPEKYQRESPWPAAQAEILNINVFKTPKDKVQCVARCCSIIMNLLSLANENAAPPGADDFVPVLMFVLIKANPPSLLSTVQYVNSFYIENDSYRPGDDSTRGEETYWWMQFVAAIEYMKTMDYRK